MGKTNMPWLLVERLSHAESEAARRWWSALSEADRRAVREGSARPRLLARFVEPGSCDEEQDEVVDLYEYLVGHELSFPEERSFHICTAHPLARRAIRRGHVPATFECPLAAGGIGAKGDASCPMRAMLDAGRGCDVRISLAHPTSAPEGGAHG